MDFKISIILDTRRILSNEKYPAKLNVYSALTQTAKKFSIRRYYDENEFAEVIKSKVSKKHQEENIYLKTIESKANEIAKDISPFDFEIFEKRFNQNKFHKNNIIDYYDTKILEFKKNKQIANATFYQSSLIAIKKFLNEELPNSVTNLNITTITAPWLKTLQNYWQEKGLSISTIGAYLRPLRAIYNYTIVENDIKNITSPFGRGKFEIPSSSKVHKALTKSAVEVLLNSKPKTQSQSIAKDFWFFSLFCNGMNIKDVALLTHNDVDIKNRKLVFVRNKTKVSTQRNLTHIIVRINDYAEDVIKRHATSESDKSNYLFKILNPKDSAEEIERKVKNFIRFINQHIKKLAIDNDVDAYVSVNWARHTFSNLAINAGGTTEFVQDSLGHKNIKTTQAYISGFEDSTREVLINKMFDFNANKISNTPKNSKRKGVRKGPRKN